MDIYQTPKPATEDAGRGKRDTPELHRISETSRQNQDPEAQENLIATQTPPITSPGALEGGHVLTRYW